jgi:hypothetical protein
MQQRMRTRLSYKPLIVAGSIALVLSGIFSTMFFFGDSEKSMAAASGDYRSKQSGNWNAVSSWQKYNGSSWVNATSAPKESDGEITIQSGHTITIPAAVTANQLTVDSGATLISNNGNFKISNGSGTDFTVRGTLTLNAKLTLNSSGSMAVYGTVNKNSGDFKVGSDSRIDIYDGGVFIRSGGNLDDSPGNWYFHAGSTYQHNVNGSSIPEASWNTTSTCLLTGMTNSLPDDLDQDFGNLTFNSGSQTGHFKLNDEDDDELGEIDGNLRVISTGSGSLTLNKNSGNSISVGGNYFHEGGTVYITEGRNCNMSVGGSLQLSGGTFAMTSSAGSNGDGCPVLTISEDLIIDGGTYDMSRYTGSSSSKGKGTLKLSGDLLLNSGTMTETASGSGKGIVKFTGNVTQNFVNTGTISNTVDFEIEEDAVVNFGEHPLTGNGSFIASSDCIMRFGSHNGITASGANGNIQVSGSRTYSADASYIYDGTSAQVTGNGLPSTVKNLSFNNAAGVTLSADVSVKTNLALESGIVSTGSNTLTVGTSVLNTGFVSRTDGWVNGNLARWIPALAMGTFDFPVGVQTYNEFSLSYTVIPSLPGLLTVSFVEIGPDQSGLPLTEENFYKVNTIGSKGYWTTSSSNGLAGGLCTISVLGNGFTGISEVADVRLLTRTNALLPWSLPGAHATGTGTVNSPRASRTGIGMPPFVTIGWGYNALPIELIFFKAEVEGRSVKMKWATAAEINNEYFTLERSEDGINFEEIGQVPGSGNTSNRRDYEYTDESPLNGDSYYRLRQTDYDGRFEVFDPDHVYLKKKVLDESALNVWPNPFDDYFDMEIKSEESGKLDISLLTMDGKLIREEAIHVDAPGTRWTFRDGNSLIPGTYILRIQCNDEVVSRKLIRK